LVLNGGLGGLSWWIGPDFSSVSPTLADGDYEEQYELSLHSDCLQVLVSHAVSKPQSQIILAPN
jgi:hypothetical protein